MSKSRVNRTDEEVRYPVNRVVGVVDTVPQLERADSALLGGGFLESEIEVICGQPAADKLRASTGRTGMMNIAMRVVEKLGMPDEETQIKNRYADSLEAGVLSSLFRLPRTSERRSLRDFSRTMVVTRSTFSVASSSKRWASGKGPKERKAVL